MLSAYATSCHVKNAVNRMKNSSVNPENLSRKRHEQQSD